LKSFKESFFLQNDGINKKGARNGKDIESVSFDQGREDFVCPTFIASDMSVHLLPVVSTLFETTGCWLSAE